MTKILVFQSRITEKRIEGERDNYRRTIGSLADIDFLSAVDAKLSWTLPQDLLAGYDGIIFGGSSDFDFHGGRPKEDPARIMSMLILSRAKHVVSYALEAGIPVLGVCFGHQLIAQMHGGRVYNDHEQSKFGAFKVQLTEEGKTDPLFSSLPKTFYAQYAHKDSATLLPEGATLLATGPDCRFSALRYGERVYTTQFHPEMRDVSIEGVVEVHESPEASTLIPKWISMVVKSCISSDTYGTPRN